MRGQNNFTYLFSKEDYTNRKSHIGWDKTKVIYLVVEESICLTVSLEGAIVYGAVHLATVKRL